MTAKQKANQARFKKVVAEAKKLRKKNPKLTQAQAVKQAWAMTYTKKKVGAAPKKKAAKKSSSYHKDTKSHNVNIRVISGIKENAFKEIVKTKDLILEQNELLKRLQEGYKKSKSKIDKEMTMMDIKTLKNDFIPHNKRYLKSLQIALKKSICK
jgi:hypothetical protein